MSLRRRLTIVVAAAVAVAITLAAVGAYVATRAELRGQIDDRLTAQANLAEQGPPPGFPDDGGGPGGQFQLPAPPDQNEGPPVAAQLVSPDGDVLFQRGDVPIPDSAGDTGFRDVDSSGQHLRVLTTELPDGPSLQLASSLEGVDAALGELRIVLFFVTMGGAAVAAFGARAFAIRLLKPVASLTGAAEHVSETEDLSRRIEVSGEDEVARLGHRFNAMLERLEASRADLDAAHEDQRRLIADASHELRTPVTALRTNIETIATGALSAGEQTRALEAAAAQAEELGTLIGDLMDLARGEPAAMEFEEVDLAAVVGEAVERARRHAPGTEFALQADASFVTGSSERIARAVNNLLDNAAQHGAGPVSVGVAGGVVTVTDHGPGVAAADAERLFDRFYRGEGARRRPGSGLGLAIVRQVAEAHGGDVSVTPANGAGAEFKLRLPLVN